MNGLYTLRNKNWYLDIDGKDFLVGHDINNDDLENAELSMARPHPMFWDYYNARPQILTPSEVDYVWSRRIGVRSQKGAPTCYCFAALAAIEMFAIRHGDTVDLSESYTNWIFMRSESRSWCEVGFRLAKGVGLLAELGVCPETLCPYDTVCGKGTPDPEAMRQAKWGISKYFFIPRQRSQRPTNCSEVPCLDGPSISNTTYLECILAQNFDIAITIDFVRDQIVKDQKFGNIYDVPTDPDCGCSPASGTWGEKHDMVIVGYNRSGDVPYFVCRDSSKYAADGHVFLSYDYIRTYARYGVVVMGISKEMYNPFGQAENELRV
jgi:hypothetical protein